MANRCPRCTGDGGYCALVHRESGCTEGYLTCSVCHGAGKISDEVQGWIDEGSKHRNERVARDESLRECAARLGVSAAIISAMETGRARPRFTQFCIACNADHPPHAPDCQSTRSAPAREEANSDRGEQ